MVRGSCGIGRGHWEAPARYSGGGDNTIRPSGREGHGGLIPHPERSHQVTTAIEPEVIRAKDLPAVLGVTKRTIQRWRHDGVLPPAIRLGPNAVGWRRSDIIEWLASRPVEGTPEYDQQRR